MTNPTRQPDARAPRMSARPMGPRRSFRYGATVVEFAIVLPLFLMLVAGIIEFGQAFRAQHALSAAARYASRAATLEGATSAKIIDKARDQCTKCMSIQSTDVTVTVAVNGVDNREVSTAAEGDVVSVSISVPYSKVGLGFYSQFLANSNLRSICTFERE